MLQGWLREVDYQLTFSVFRNPKIALGKRTSSELREQASARWQDRPALSELEDRFEPRQHVHDCRGWRLSRRICLPHHSYAEPALAARSGNRFRECISASKIRAHSIRTHTDANGKTYAITGGASFKPGHRRSERESRSRMERWLTELPGRVRSNTVGLMKTPSSRRQFRGQVHNSKFAHLIAAGSVHS